MPRPPRFFISPDQIDGTSIAITGEDIRHIATVLRMKPGEKLMLCDGQGTEYRCAIASISRTEIRTEIESREARPIPAPSIELGQGLPKADKMDFIVQKATELGVSSVTPILTERTIVKIRDDEKRISRWQRISREAAMQSNRPDIPTIGGITSFEEYLRTLNAEPGTLLLFPWEEATVPIKTVLNANRGVKRIITLIGPEGGFSLQEAEKARQKGFHPVRLGSNILRTETAAVAVLAIIGYAFLD